jgi:hypothetical protein
MMKFSHFCLPLLLAAVGCAPKIFQFEATPSKVCKGQTATLHWNASHGGTITATPPNESPGTVFGQGSSVVTPQASGTYRFESKRLITSTEQEVHVEVLDPCTEPGPAVAAAPAPATVP